MHISNTHTDFCVYEGKNPTHISSVNTYKDKHTRVCMYINVSNWCVSVDETKRITI